MKRREFLGLLGSGAIGVAGCSNDTTRRMIMSKDPAIRRRERRRQSTGRIVEHRLQALRGVVDLGGREVNTWLYDQRLPGREIRAQVGDTLSIHLQNDLPSRTTVHWHGLALRNDMDGVHDLTQPAIDPGSSFNYRFKVVDPGTYWFHPHMGLQLDRGLYAPLIVEDLSEPAPYDTDQVIVLDDWLDGIDGRTPERAFKALRTMGMSSDMSGMDMGSGRGTSRPAAGLLGGDGGDVSYPLHLINGRPPGDRPTLAMPAGGRARIRIINAASDTAYRVAFGGALVTVTHADGYPVRPIATDALLIGMGERYDLLVQVGSEPVLLVAAAEGKHGQAEAVLRPRGSKAAAPPAGTKLPELRQRVVTVEHLRPRAAVQLKPRVPDFARTVALTGAMAGYSWGMDGRPFEQRIPIEVEVGQRVRLSFTNQTSMWHPMHIHGHTFAAGSQGVRKDTIAVLPGQSVRLEFDADNPGQWMTHCHNTYHLEAGMATVLSYVR